MQGLSNDIYLFVTFTSNIKSIYRRLSYNDLSYYMKRHNIYFLQITKSHADKLSFSHVSIIDNRPSGAKLCMFLDQQNDCNTHVIKQS